MRREQTRYFIGTITDEYDRVRTCLGCKHASWQGAESCAKTRAFSWERVGHQEIGAKAVRRG